MTSIFQRALGADFDRLHPQLQRRFGFGLADGVGCVGRGTMDRIWHGRGFTRPFLALGAKRHILLPQSGVGIPFTIENYAYRDALGRESLSFVRTFSFDTARRWDATMVYNAERGTIVDYLGTHQHVAVDLRPSVDEWGGLVIRSGEQRFHGGPVSFRVPGLVSGVAEVHESYDEDLGRFRIKVVVANRRFGPLFGYHGTFTAAYVTGDAVPSAVKPRRVQVRA
ncbi:DUF4166 domain-containing protein [Kutzneria sp. 744]|uniref:DUF4166 domain-containing protein n=1 Tax=Kutzneria sp. (strain 744) TaxID=345341 RepID=UPI0003EED246|nr:DUF4166 domain-containing protein [Kutzneria sp. 744]EWM09836.1 hypothetical protein KUTG_00140 [Kutzneria sp. 744]